MRISIGFAWLCLGILALTNAPFPTSAPAAETTEQDTEFFERRVRPVLVERCFSCHGNGQRKGELSLASREDMLRGGASGPVLVPGKPEASLLLDAVGYEGDVQMPPDAPLPAPEIAALRQWIAAGAPWPARSESVPVTPGKVSAQDRQFWSFRPFQTVQPPTVKHDWVRKPHDTFVLQARVAAGLRPVPAADKRTLARRVYLDLLGFLPAPEELDQFLRDQRPDAYARLVDRLLASPAYGERWARHWLDIARYAEDQAHTFQARLYPQGYRYRDWVVQAFNNDMPFDEFVVAQLAGDLTTDENRLDRLPALGFMALGPVYYGDGGCAPKARADEWDDRVDTLGRGLLGLTIACARCHDHKFDPISTRDYYALAGVFASTRYDETPMAPAADVERYQKNEARVKELEKLVSEIRQLEAKKLVSGEAARLAKYLELAWEIRQLQSKNQPVEIAPLAEKNELVTEFVTKMVAFLAPEKVTRQPLLGVWQQSILPLKNSEATNEKARTTVRAAASRLQQELVAALTAREKIETDFQRAQAKVNTPQEKAKIKKQKLDDQSARLLKFWLDDPNAPFQMSEKRRNDGLPAAARERINSARKEAESARKALGPKYPVIHGLADDKPRDLRVHVRGNPQQLGELAPRRFPEVLTGPNAPRFTQGSGRGELARTLATHPLTARVFVNRVWLHHFGRGLVNTPSNFGRLGERPAHPELLDWLAARFRDSGYSVKALHREILLSATYQQSSAYDAENEVLDPENRLLWRMNRRRLDVEAWRDTLLSAAGTLDRQLGGPPRDLADPKNRRRTLYAAISRHQLDGMLRLFDFPDPNLSSERRVITIVPMQQLFALNSAFIVEQARHLAQRVAERRLPNEPARVDYVYHLLFGRAPKTDEMNLALEFLKPLPSTQEPKDPTTIGSLTLWEQYAQALLATNELLYSD